MRTSIGIALFISFILGTFYLDYRTEKTRERLTNEFNYSFKGVVIKKEKLSFRGEGGLIKLKLDNKNLFIDHRQKEFICCVANNGFAELITTYFSSYEIDDRVFIDGKNKKIIITNPLKNGTIKLFLIERMDDIHYTIFK